MLTFLAISLAGDNAGFGQGDFKDNSTNLAISETHSFSPTMVNEFRFGYSRLRTPPSLHYRHPGHPGAIRYPSIPQGNATEGCRLSISTALRISELVHCKPNRRVSDTIQFTENLTKTHGAHNSKRL